MASSPSVWEQEWPKIEAAYIKLKNNLEGLCERPVDSEERMKLYTCILDLSCKYRPNGYHQEQLYNKYQYLVKDYNMETLLPSLRDKHDEHLIRELVKRWSNYKVLLRWLFSIFSYLDRYYVPNHRLPKLKDIGITTFRDIVYHEMQSSVKDTVLAQISKEREGEEIDRGLLKNVIDVYCEIGMETYEEDFESFFLEDTASYYSSKASRWIQEDSCPEYMIKAEKCLKLEKDRATQYLHSITETKLVEIVQKELLVVVAKQLIENEYSGFHALLRNDKMDDISRMFWLYDPIPQELESVALLFKEHVITEGNALIQQASDAATSGVQDQVLIRKLIELHDKSMVYVDECFQKNTLFSKALKEAFEVIRNKTVAEMSSAEILATYFDNLLKIQ